MWQKNFLVRSGGGSVPKNRVYAASRVGRQITFIILRNNIALQQDPNVSVRNPVVRHGLQWNKGVLMDIMPCNDALKSSFVFLYFFFAIRVKF